MKTRGPLWIATSAWIALLLLALPVGAAAEPRPAAGRPAAGSDVPGLQMEVLAAYGGHFKYGEWLPVWVYLENSGRDLEAKVRVRVSGRFGATTYSRQVSLPSGSRKRVPVYVLPNNYSRQLEVELVDAQDQLLTSQKAPVKPQPNVNYFAGLVAPERGAMSLLSGASTPGQARPMVLIDLTVDELPERAEALRSFDSLILNDTDTSSLTPGQRLALETWVRQGGRLVIGGGAGARRSVAGIPEELLPLVPRDEREVDELPGLAEYAGGEPVRVPGPFLVSVGDLRPGQTLAEQGGVPLLREQRVDDGRVIWSALDLAISPFDAWAGTISFWEQLIIADAAYPLGMPPDVSPRQMQAGQMTYALSNMPALELPSVRGLSVLLAIYIVLVGPINYLILRWRKRLHWGWVTIPLITVLFSGGAFGLGYALRGTDLVISKIALVAAHPDGTAQVDTYVGLFSPSRQSYEIEVEGENLLSPINPEQDPFMQNRDDWAREMEFVQGAPGRVRGLAINQWSMQTFMAEGAWDDLGPLEQDLRFEEGALVGTVRNGTGHTLKDAVVIVGTQFTRLGDLAPGAEAEVRLELADRDLQFFGPPVSYRLFEKELEQMGPGGPPREIQRKQQILDALLNSGQYSPISSFRPMGGGDQRMLTFLAWFDVAPPDVRVGPDLQVGRGAVALPRKPAQHTTTLFYTPVSYRLPETGRFAVPAGFIDSQVIEMPQEGGPCGAPGLPAVYINRGQAVLEFRLPKDVRGTQIDHLTLSIRSEGNWQQPPQVALYHWPSQAWAELDDAVIGDNVIPDAQSLVSEEAWVRVRLSVGDLSGGACYHLGLGFEGSK